MEGKVSKPWVLAVPDKMFQHKCDCELIIEDIQELVDAGKANVTDVRIKTICEAIVSILNAAPPRRALEREMSRLPEKFAGRRDYFAVNSRAQGGATTSFRVAGLLGELARRYWLLYDAKIEARRLNRAYELGFKHGLRARPARADMRER